MAHISRYISHILVIYIYKHVVHVCISPTHPAHSGSLEVVLDVYRLLRIEHAAHDDEVYSVCGRKEIHLNTTHTYKEVEKEEKVIGRWSIE